MEPRSLLLGFRLYMLEAEHLDKLIHLCYRLAQPIIRQHTDEDRIVLHPPLVNDATAVRRGAPAALLESTNMADVKHC